MEDNTYSDEDEPAYFQPEDANDLITKLVFIDYPTGILPAGEQINVVIGVFNIGTENIYNMTGIVGHLTTPNDYESILQNFTGYMYPDHIIGPGESVSMYYKFTIDATADTHPYGLRINLYYTNDAGQRFLNPVYQDSIDVGAPLEGDDPLWPLFLTLAVGAGVVVWWFGGPNRIAEMIGITSKKTGGGRTVRSRAAEKEMEKSKEKAADDEWLAETQAATKKKSPTAKNSNKK